MPVFFWKSKSAIIDAESAKQLPLAEQRVRTLNGEGGIPKVLAARYKISAGL
jgi:hypothetical protein